MALVLANVVGWFAAHWRWVLYGIAAIALIVVFGLVYRSCNKPPKMDEKAIAEAQKAIAENDRKAMEKVLIDSEVKEKQIDENLVDANAQKVNAIAEAKKKAQAMTNEELRLELEKRSKE